MTHSANHITHVNPEGEIRMGHICSQQSVSVISVAVGDSALAGPCCIHVSTVHIFKASSVQLIVHVYTWLCMHSQEIPTKSKPDWQQFNSVYDLSSQGYYPGSNCLGNGIISGEIPQRTARRLVAVERNNCTSAELVVVCFKNCCSENRNRWPTGLIKSEAGSKPVCRINGVQVGWAKVQSFF